MTQDEIVKMARETGLVRTGDKWVEPARWGVTELVHFAALVAAAEREACAKVCEDIYNDPKDNNGYDAYYTRPYLECADAIRARGDKPCK